MPGTRSANEAEWPPILRPLDAWPSASRQRRALFPLHNIAASQFALRGPVWVVINGPQLSESEVFEGVRHLVALTVTQGDRPERNPPGAAHLSLKTLGAEVVGIL